MLIQHVDPFHSHKNRPGKTHYKNNNNNNSAEGRTTNANDYLGSEMIALKNSLDGGSSQENSIDSG